MRRKHNFYEFDPSCQPLFSSHGIGRKGTQGTRKQTFLLCVPCVLSRPFTLAFPTQARVRPRRRQRLWRGKKNFGYFEKQTRFFEKTARFRKNFEFYFLEKDSRKTVFPTQKNPSCSRLIQVNPSQSRGFGTFLFYAKSL
jgi:hypothetical protein